MARPRKLSETRRFIQLGELTVPLRIITEAGRNGSRAAVGRKAVIFRFPYGLREKELRKQYEHLETWLHATYREKPAVFRHFHTPDLAENYLFKVREREFRIELAVVDSAAHRITYQKKDRFQILFARQDDSPRREAVIAKLLAKALADQYLPEVWRRVLELNDGHFGQQVRAVKLKDTYSRWGSCSHDGNINLSTRLILAPTEIMDAVIIHELAHLIEANHGPDFWALVSRALPDYKRHDEWLKRHGSTLRFVPQTTA